MDIDLKNETAKSFVNFLIKNGYEIVQKNHRHVSGQGYSPSEYYTDVNINTAILKFLNSNHTL